VGPVLCGERVKFKHIFVSYPGSRSMRRVPCVVCVKCVCVYVCGCDHPFTFPTQALGGCLLRSGGGGGGLCSNNIYWYWAK